MIKSIIKLLAGLALLIAVIVGGPLAGIWSLNTLFPVLAIPYSWETWLSFLLLFGSVTGLRVGGNRGK